MNLPELFRIPGIIQGLTAELFARQIERAITDDVIAVEISRVELRKLFRRKCPVQGMMLQRTALMSGYRLSIHCGVSECRNIRTIREAMRYTNRRE